MGITSFVFSINLSSARPNIFIFINVLKGFHTNAYIVMSNVHEIKDITNRSYLNKKPKSKIL
jgi:hypothetical protein